MSKVLLPSFESKVKKKYQINRKEFTVCVSLIGRMNPDARCVMDEICRYMSQVAQVASRMSAHWIASVLDNKDCTREEKLKRLGKTFIDSEKSQNANNPGSKLFIQAMTYIRTGKKTQQKGSIMEPSEVDEFEQLFPTKTWNKDEWKLTDVQTNVSSTMVSDLKRLMKERLNAKLPLWVRHRLRKLAWKDFH